MKSQLQFKGKHLLIALTVLLAGAAGALGCEPEDVPQADGGLLEPGENCTGVGQCQSGLVCDGTGECARPSDPNTADVGEGCAAAVECRYHLVCSSTSQCALRGDGIKDDPCKGDQDCGPGLTCASSGLCDDKGVVGTYQTGEACSEPSDCAFTLVCAADKCARLAYWPGSDCESVDTGELRAYFEIPRGAEALKEFYRQPFPSDIRLKNGRIDLKGHPNPKDALPDGLSQIVGSYFDAIEEDVDGFGVNMAIHIRTSGTVDYGTVTVNKDKTTGAEPTIRFVNIDPDSPGYGLGVSFALFAGSDRQKYMCYNWISVRPQVGRPLQYNTTYAVILRKGIATKEESLVGQDKDFKIVIGDAEPADADEKAAWDAYAPLRTYLKDVTLHEGTAIDTKTVVGAAVFTTMNPRKKMAQFRQVVRSRPDPNPSDLMLCDGAKKSPCEALAADTHKCPDSSDASFHELQATYQTPVFQTGTAPYETTGGAIAYDQDNKPKVAREESACLALTIPKGAVMPAEGWPVVIFAHGTNGSYRSFINGGTAKSLAKVVDGVNTVSQMAMIGIDGGMHGPRRNSDKDPGDLFFNLLNPRAARDNVYQAVADKYQLLRVIENLELDASKSPTGSALKFDTNKIYYFGHSQGATEGVPFVAYEPKIAASVFSGAGGYLIGSMLNKTKPVNVSAMIRLALADNSVGSTHPLLNLIQLFFEEVDTINYGKALFAKPVEGIDPRHIFMSYGIADGYTPPLSIDGLATVMEAHILDQPAEYCGDGFCTWNETCKTCAADCPEKECDAEQKYQTVSTPVKENTSSGGVKATAAMGQYSGGGDYDDHFVIFEDENAKMQSTHFLGTAARDGAPTIPKAK
jgi:hypothetical protein